jgi:hypothetical protein
MPGFMGSDKLSSFCNYYVKPHLPASCGAFTFWRENEADGQDFISGAGARFRHSRDLRIVVIRESLRESIVWRVGQVLPLQGVYWFESSWDSRLWVIACRCSHLIACLVYCWWIPGVGFGYVHYYDIIMLLLTFDVDMGQRSTWLCLF